MTGRITAILLDLDGTLVDSASELTRAINAGFATTGRAALTRHDIEGMIGDGIPTLVERALAATGDVPRGAAFDDILARVRKHYDDGPLSTPYPGVIETLAALHDAGYVLGVCTNKPQRSAEMLLDGIGLAPHVDAIGGGDAFPVKKPDPGHLLGVLANIGHDPGTAVMVGDSANDARAAAGAGIPFIAVTYGYCHGPISELGAVDVIDRFDSLPAALDRLERTFD
jgi:phosphoglycolate phosphatase